MSIALAPPSTGLLGAAHGVAESAARNAAQADRDGDLSPEVIAAVREAGFARHLVPARYGGTEGTFAELTRAVTAVGEACAATAWFASLSAYSARFAAYLPVEGQDELWADGADAIIATGLIPSGAVTKTDGGWLVSGTWRYVSGVAWSDWVLLCALGPVQGVGDARFFALPASACRVEQTWDSTGMRATGSHSVVLPETFVPDHRSVARAEVLAGPNRTSQAVCHNTSFQAVGTLTFVAPALGAALGALGSCVELLKHARRTPSGDEGLARSAALIDGARLLVERNAATADAGNCTPQLLARNARDAALAAEILVSAVNALVRAAGTHGLSQSHPLERHWRDVVAAASHVALRFETAPAKTFADILLA
ncbi:acyl-CoA dehydrogenase family protein [Actinocrinis sp.]|uniref:acyl-CoA dehydrogenase family protein n=1 Tax=Actinocrinis sp. TaxID=1920516 RepID=UPI002D61A4F2|nr:acyl-CoA dehydrogenase family protein [Actinocrinis sp.]HZP50531.1 acyl-CoA dehydrogenase family protein [Actinocrinis sp.]